MKNLKWMLLVVGIMLIIAVAPALANGKPVKIYLNFLPEFSNAGPTDATGTADVSIGEAWVKLSADNMPPLTGNLYEGWLREVDTGNLVSVGKFNADENNHIDYYVELDNLPVTNYRYFFITIEPDPDPSPDPDTRISIAGVFPDPRLAIVQGTPTPVVQVVAGSTTGETAPPATSEGGTGTVQGTATPPPPAILPITGREAYVTYGQVLALGLTIAGLGMVLILWTLRHKKQM